ncbi:oligosaccharyl transferase, archaeosortase A system-associated [Chloroflexota bacterium]
MKVRIFSPQILPGIFVAILFGIALYLRVGLPYDQIFGIDWIKFASVDAYYHMRLVDNLVHNFPHLNSFDPFFIYPGGVVVGGFRFFDWLLAGIIWVIGLGSPTQHTVDVIGVYFPPVLGALTIIPIYFIGKELFGRWAGVIAAGLFTLLAGESIGRSILGFTDHDVANTLFTTTTMLFLILAIKTARERKLTFSHFKRRDREIITKPIIYSLLVGVFLGIYLLTWAGALLFVFLISVYLIVQFIIDYLKREPTDYLCLIGVTLFFVSLIIFAPFSPVVVYAVVLIIALLIPIGLSSIAWLLSHRQIKPAYYPLALSGMALVGLVILYTIAPSMLKAMLNMLDIFTWGGGTVTTLEMQPLIKPLGEWSISIAWGNFTTGFFFFSIALLYLIFYKRLIRKQGSAEENLLLVWSLVILAAALGQRRFASYLAVNVALLTAYISWQVIWFAGSRKGYRQARNVGVCAGIILLIAALLSNLYNTDLHIFLPIWVIGIASLLYGCWGWAKYKGRSEWWALWGLLPPIGFIPLALMQSEAATTKLKEMRKESKGVPIYLINLVLAIIGVLLLAFFTNIPPAIAVTERARFAPSDAWQTSLSWMKENTPDPFGNPNFYYERYESPLPGESYNYPESAYGVTAWWDYGYWITRIAHRLPSANPGQTPAPIINIANLLLSQEEPPTHEIMQKLDSSYIILDYSTATSKFWAVATWAGINLTEYFETYFLPYENQFMPVNLYYPKYYHSLCARLYNFDGQAVTDVSPLVVSYEEKINQDGRTYKEIINAEDFATYEEALSYIESKKSTNVRLIGGNPFVSPVPLEALQNYKLIYGSEIGILHRDAGMVPEVKIFEYTKE